MSGAAHEHGLVASYDSNGRAEAAVRALEGAGVDVKGLSIIGKDLRSPTVVGFYTSGDQMTFLGGRAAFWGALWGVLVNGAFLLVPTIGPVVVMGPLVQWIVGALEQDPGRSGGVLAMALARVGFPTASVEGYEREVKAGRILVIVLGTAGAIEQARAVLSATAPTR
jgi:hypothetical protein